MYLGISSPLQHEGAEDWAKKHIELGLKSVVFPLNYKDEEGRIKEYAMAAREAGLTIAEVGVWRNLLAEDETERKEAFAYAIGQLQLAEALGARCCVNIAGAMKGARWDGPHKSNFSKEAYDKTVQIVQRIVDEVKPVRTKYTLEPMPWMIPSGPEEYLLLLEEIGRDSVGVHMDMVNMITSPERYFFQEEFMDKCFALLKGKICSCHLKDVHLHPEYTFQLKECACGAGELNLKHYIALAQKEDPTMPMIIEHLDSDEAYQESVAYVQKNYCQ